MLELADLGAIVATLGATTSVEHAASDIAASATT
jgi:hypothetical protein